MQSSNKKRVQICTLSLHDSHERLAWYQLRGRLHHRFGNPVALFIVAAVTRTLCRFVFVANECQRRRIVKVEGKDCIIKPQQRRWPLAERSRRVRYCYQFRPAPFRRHER